jgi:hypothetical protein
VYFSIIAVNLPSGHKQQMDRILLHRRKTKKRGSGDADGFCDFKDSHKSKTKKTSKKKSKQISKNCIESDITTDNLFQLEKTADMQAEQGIDAADLQAKEEAERQRAKEELESQQDIDAADMRAERAEQTKVVEDLQTDHADGLSDRWDRWKKILADRRKSSEIQREPPVANTGQGQEHPKVILDEVDAELDELVIDGVKTEESTTGSGAAVMMAALDSPSLEVGSPSQADESNAQENRKPENMSDVDGPTMRPAIVNDADDSPKNGLAFDSSAFEESKESTGDGIPSDSTFKSPAVSQVSDEAQNDANKDIMDTGGGVMITRVLVMAIVCVVFVLGICFLAVYVIRRRKRKVKKVAVLPTRDVRGESNATRSVQFAHIAPSSPTFQYLPSLNQSYFVGDKTESCVSRSRY